MSRGNRNLREFLAAPETVQDAFMSRIALESRRESEMLVGLCQIGAPHGPPAPCRVRWDDAWRRRCRNARLVAAGKRDELDRDAVIDAMPLSEWWLLLTGEQPGRDRKVLCPFHDERTPSCSVRETRFRCFGCDKRGTVIDLAAHVWDLDPERDFVDVLKRLGEMGR